MCLVSLFLIYGWVGYFDVNCHYYFSDYHAQGRLCGGEELAEPMEYGRLIITGSIGMVGAFIIFYKPRK